MDSFASEHILTLQGLLDSLSELELSEEQLEEIRQKLGSSRFYERMV